jgi:uncharacterized protein
MGRTAIILLRMAGTMLVAGVGGLTALQRNLLYSPDRSRPDLAAAAVPAARVLTLRTSDGLDLLAWFAPPRDAIEPVVLFLHGSAGNIGGRALLLAALSRLGWGALLLEYRGYGGNAGSPSETGLLEDARAGYAALGAMGLSARRILLWGESLGTGVATRLATEAEIGALLLQAPYTSILDVARRQFPYLPLKTLMADRFELIGRIKAVRAPILVMVAGRDRVVPPEMGRAVYAAAPEPKALWLSPEAGHGDLSAMGAVDRAAAFVREHWKRAP